MEDRLLLFYWKSPISIFYGQTIQKHTDYTKGSGGTNDDDDDAKKQKNMQTNE